MLSFQHIFDAYFAIQTKICSSILCFQYQTLVRVVYCDLCWLLNTYVHARIFFPPKFLYLLEKNPDMIENYQKYLVNISIECSQSV